MKPTKLYIHNFMCYDKAYIDFTDFNTAVIIGKVENNDLVSNGVGKTTIFKAIEYALFNYADTNLEKVIREDVEVCKVVFDFIIGEQEYRIARIRTINGSKDLSLLQRNNQEGSVFEVYHSTTQEPWLGKEHTQKYWKDLSGSRATDTEKDLDKLIKLNYKAFRSAYHFVQNDMISLSMVTPEKRKAILKETLNLAIYYKLEKLAKDKSNLLIKDIEKHTTLIENLGNPQQEINILTDKLSLIEIQLTAKQTQLSELTEQHQQYLNQIKDLTTAHSHLENKFATSLTTQKSLTVECAKLQSSINEYQNKKSDLTQVIKQFTEQIATLQLQEDKLKEIDLSQLITHQNNNEKHKEVLVQFNMTLQNYIKQLSELQVPLPNTNFCERCRQPMTEQHRQEEKQRIQQAIILCQNNIQQIKININKTTTEINNTNKTINQLNQITQQLQLINQQITTKQQEINHKNNIINEYTELLINYTNDLFIKNQQLQAVSIDLKNSSLEEANSIKLKIETQKQQANTLNQKIIACNKELTHFNNNKAILQHSIEQNTNNLIKKDVLNKMLIELQNKYAIYPTVIQAFSTTGIPNLIIQNILDDLQIEANQLLAQLKPGLQLTFQVQKIIEKTGDQADTLEILYTVNGRERYYEQLSGAMKLAVAFSLKLGLSFLLHKIMGINVQLLLLDEIDQSLDKASLDAFVEMIKFFQKDYTILIITHNDRLKDKFPYHIVVEQDSNMISRAQVITN